MLLCMHGVLSQTAVASRLSELWTIQSALLIIPDSGVDYAVLTICLLIYLCTRTCYGHIMLKLSKISGLRYWD